MTAKEKFVKCKDWKCRVKIINLLHCFMQVKRKKWGMRDTARYFNISLGAVSEAILLTNHWELISSCTTRNEALELIHAKEDKKATTN